MSQPNQEPGGEPPAESPANPVAVARTPAGAGTPLVTTFSRWALGLLALIFAMHALDSADAWTLDTVLPRMTSELGLDQDHANWLPTAFLVGAAIAAPVAGYFADRLSRPRLLAIVAAGWGLAVVATGLARSEGAVLFARVAAGACGAGATVIALTLLADALPRRVRGRVFAVYFLAMPAGTLVGRLAGAALPAMAGWPAQFFAIGATALALALLALLVPEPVRGSSEPVAEDRLRGHERVGPSHDDYIDLMVNSSFNYAVFGMAFASFIVSGLAYWYPVFLTSAGVEPERAGALASWIFLAAASAGLVAGGWLTDAFAATRPRRLFLVPGLAMIAAIAALLAAIYAPSPVAAAGLFATEAALFFLVPPSFTILCGVTMPGMRGVGFGVALAAGHLLGDLWSPSLLGWVVDTFGQPDTMATSFGRLLSAIGAHPIARRGDAPVNLVAGLLALVPALLVAGVVLLAGIRHLPRELTLMIAKLRAVPTPRSTR